MDELNRWFSPWYQSDDKAGGGDAGGTKDANDGGTAGGKKDEGKKDIVFTPEQQAYIDSLMGDRARRGGEAALNKFVADLGAKSADEVKEALAAYDKLKKEQMSEVERVKAEAAQSATKLAEAEKAKTEAVEMYETTLKRMAVNAASASVNALNADDVWMFIRNDPTLFAEVALAEDRLKVTGVEAVIAKVVKARPHWFKPGKSTISTPRPPARGAKTEDADKADDDSAGAQEVARSYRGKF